MTPNQMKKTLDYFNIEYIEYSDRLSLPCPVHGSDNEESCSIYLDSGIWKCWTNECESEILDDFKPRGSNFIGFVRGLLEVQQNRFISYREANKFLLDLFENIEEIKRDSYDIGLDRFLFEKHEHKRICSKRYIQNSLQIPSKYFIDRGFSKETLTEFCVGDCHTEYKEMYKRAVAPIFDHNGLEMIGCVGRSIFEKCETCKLYHPANKCQSKLKWFKWKNSSGFKSEHYFYNWWNNKSIKERNCAILVEGQGDVWRLYEAGYTNVLGLFSDKLTRGQLFLLESLYIDNVIIATDNDVKGIEGAQKIQEKLSGSFYTKIIHPTEKDWGEMTIKEVNRCLK